MDLKDMQVKVQRYEQDMSLERQMQEHRRMQLKEMVHHNLAETFSFKNSIHKENLLEDKKIAFRYMEVSLVNHGVCRNLKTTSDSSRI